MILYTILRNECAAPLLLILSGKWLDYGSQSSAVQCIQCVQCMALALLLHVVDPIFVGESHLGSGILNSAHPLDLCTPRMADRQVVLRSVLAREHICYI